MKRAIAKIRLAPGNAGWFDPLTNIYLTLSEKECFVYNDQDTSNIRKAIKENKLELKEGRLPSPVSKDKKEVVKKKSINKLKEPEKVKDKVIEKIEVIEEKKEEVKAERPRKKVKRKPDDSNKLPKQEEEVKKEETKKEEVSDESPLAKVAELIKEKDKAEENNNG